MKEYIGEHLFIGNLGHFFVVLALVSAIVSGLFYIRKSGKEQENIRFGRAFFWIHSVAVLGIFITLFVIIQQHYFEYAYAYQHSSLQLPLRYMVSCFWEGQEGSFLLWMVWNSVLGIVLILTAKKWERGVLATMALAQMVLTSMLLGISIGDVLGAVGIQTADIYTFGSSPFQLLRDKMANAPFFSSPNYLANLVDGTGLNPLLQNYWMVIHPPTLFLGFALTIVPFAFAVTSLFKGEYRKWIKPALPWALAGGMVLGAGIIMGGFWAYESLSFGGYWAWDPVENASLVPWLLLIAGIHLMIIKKVTNTATIAAYVLIIAAFILVLYATFLTRSGVLGETSVHSFTDLGLAGQLMQFVVMFIWLPIVAVTAKKNQRLMMVLGVVLLVIVLPFYTKLAFYPLLLFTVGGIVWFAIQLSKSIKDNDDAESIKSREFWMFIGALMLTLSALQVIITTSIPVFNKILGTSMAPPVDAIGHYNRWQMPIAIVVAILLAIGQYFQYKKATKMDKLRKGMLYSGIAAILLTVGGIFLFEIQNPMLVIFMAAGFFALVANFLYAITYLRKQTSQIGASIAHIGFALMLLGVLVSSAKQQVITADFSGKMGMFDQEMRKENMMLYKGQKERLGDYWVTYQGDSISGEDIYFKVNYKSIDSDEEFTLMPNTQISESQNLLPNPDTRHYLTYDIYTHITSLPMEQDSVTWRNVREVPVVPGDSVVTNNGTIYFTAVEQGDGAAINLKNTKLVKAVLVVRTNRGEFEAKPIFGINDHTTFSLREQLLEPGIRVAFDIRAEEGKTQAYLEVAETDPQPKYIVMKAIMFPYINLLWLGTVLMVIGFGWAGYRRLELKRGR